jgi:hypothetical protein
MDTFDKFLESLSLDPDGLTRQFMNLSAFFNIVAASIMGFMVLAIYLASSGRAKRDRNLYMVIPVLAVLMAVVMRVEGSQALAFFGIFGILSVIRFRSEITDQKGVTFILFAVIEGVIVGVNAYVLAILAWLIVSGSILIGRYFMRRSPTYRLVLRYPSVDLEEARAEASAWFGEHGILCAFAGLGASSRPAGRSGKPKEGCKAEFLLSPASESALLGLVPAFMAAMRERGIEAELKRSESD